MTKLTKREKARTGASPCRARAPPAQQGTLLFLALKKRTWKDAEVLDVQELRAPLPRSWQWLDGSAFADLPRASVPVTNIYLPFFENSTNGLHFAL